MTKSILIAGVAGFLGSAIAEAILKKGYRVYGIDDLSGGDYMKVDNLLIKYPNFAFEPIELSAISRMAAHFDYVLNFTSPCSNVEFMENDQLAKIRSLKNFIDGLELAHRLKAKYIYPSSASVYGANVNEYAKTKLEMEAIQKLVGKTDVLALRIFAAYGGTEDHKKHYASVIYQFINNVIDGDSIQVYGDGNQTRDFVYIDDVANFIANNLDNETTTLDIGSGTSVSLNDLVFIIENLVGKKATVDYIITPQKNYLEHTRMEGEPNCHTKIEDGILKTIEYIKCQKVKHTTLTIDQGRESKPS